MLDILPKNQRLHISDIFLSHNFLGILEE